MPCQEGILRRTKLEDMLCQGSIIQDHSWVAEYAMLAPGSVLPAFSYIPPGQVWAGNPVRYT